MLKFDTTNKYRRIIILRFPCLTYSSAEVSICFRWASICLLIYRSQGLPRALPHAPVLLILWILFFFVQFIALFATREESIGPMPVPLRLNTSSNRHLSPKGKRTALLRTSCMMRHARATHAEMMRSPASSDVSSRLAIRNKSAEAAILSTCRCNSSR